MQYDDAKDRIGRVMEMIEAAEWVHDKPKFTKESISEIKELTKECRETKLFKENSRIMPEWMKTESPENLWIQMCIKVVEAPTTFHMMSTPVLILPLIADALDRENK